MELHYAPCLDLNRQRAALGPIDSHLDLVWAERNIDDEALSLLDLSLRLIVEEHGVSAQTVRAASRGAIHDDPALSCHIDVIGPPRPALDPGKHPE
jgi:hypothetical protein